MSGRAPSLQDAHDETGTLCRAAWPRGLVAGAALGFRFSAQAAETTYQTLPNASE
jgi:hypothetical protein